MALAYSHVHASISTRHLVDIQYSSSPLSTYRVVAPTELGPVRSFPLVSVPAVGHGRLPVIPRLMGVLAICPLTIPTLIRLLRDPTVRTISWTEITCRSKDHWISRFHHPPLSPNEPSEALLTPSNTWSHAHLYLAAPSIDPMYIPLQADNE